MFALEKDDRPILSGREREVLLLIARGFSAKEVAQQTNLSPRTVEHHVENIRNKLRARNRAHIVSKALAFGAISLGDRPDQYEDSLAPPAMK
jgi:DNA-binding CsgD family transcriptional regulator